MLSHHSLKLTLPYLSTHKTYVDFMTNPYSHSDVCQWTQTPSDLVNVHRDIWVIRLSQQSEWDVCIWTPYQELDWGPCSDKYPTELSSSSLYAARHNTYASGGQCSMAPSLLAVAGGLLLLVSFSSAVSRSASIYLTTLKCFFYKKKKSKWFSSVCVCSKPEETAFQHVPLRTPS